MASSPRKHTLAIPVPAACLSAQCIPVHVAHDLPVVLILVQLDGLLAARPQRAALPASRLMLPLRGLAQFMRLACSVQGAGGGTLRAAAGLKL